MVHIYERCSAYTQVKYNFRCFDICNCILFIVEKEISKAAIVEKPVKIDRNILLSDIDHMNLISALSKSKSFPESVIDSVCKAPSVHEGIDIISSFVENGSPDVLDEFCSVLRDVGHSDIVKSISPCDIHIKAGKINIKSAFHLITCIDFYKKN